MTIDVYLYIALITPYHPSALYTYIPFAHPPATYTTSMTLSVVGLTLALALIDCVALPYYHDISPYYLPICLAHPTMSSTSLSASPYTPSYLLLPPSNLTASHIPCLQGLPSYLLIP